MKSYTERCDEGKERNTAWQLLTPAEQLRDLDRRLGKGIGARKQRKHLHAKINKEATA